MPPHLDHAAMSAIRAHRGRGAPPAMARFNRSVALQELESQRAGGAPSRLLLDWILACASCNNNESDPAPLAFDGVSGVPALLGHVGAPEGALPARSAGALGVAAAEADSVWADLGRHIVGAGPTSPASGPDASTRAVPASVLAALALTFPMQFAREVVDKGKAVGVIKQAPTGRRSTRKGALPGGFELDGDAAAAGGSGFAEGRQRDEVVAEAAARAVVENSSASLGASVPGVVPKASEALPSVVSSSTFAADVVAARRDTVTDTGGAAALVRALNIARGRALAGGGGFADRSEAMVCPSSYLVPTPAAMLEVRAQFTRTEDLHSAVFDGLADTLSRLDAGSEAGDAEVEEAVTRARRGGIPLSLFREQAPEIFALLTSIPEFVELAVSVRASAATTLESERLAEAVVMAPSRSPRQAVRAAIAQLLEAGGDGADDEKAEEGGGATTGPSLVPGAGEPEDEEAATGPALAPAPSQAVAPRPAPPSASAAVPGMAFAADTAELLLGVVPAVVGGRAMTGPGLDLARASVVSLLRPDLCVVTREAFGSFLDRLAAKSTIGPRLDDAAARAHLRFATPSQAMLDALAGLASADGALGDWPGEPVDVVPNTYVSVVFLLARTVGFLLANPPGSVGAAAARADALTAALASSGAGDDPALVFTAWRRSLRPGASVDEAGRRLALVRAMDRRDDEADASAVGGAGVHRGPARHSKAGWGNALAPAGGNGPEKRRPGHEGGAATAGEEDQTGGGGVLPGIGTALSTWTWGGGCVPSGGAGRCGQSGDDDSQAGAEDPTSREQDVGATLRALAARDEDGDPVAAEEEESPADYVPGPRPGRGGAGGGTVSGSVTAPPSVALRAAMADMDASRHGGRAVQARGLTTREEDAEHADLDDVERRAADWGAVASEEEQRRREHASKWSRHDLQRMQKEAEAAKLEADRRAANPDHEVPGSEIRAVCSGAGSEGVCAVM